MAARLLSPARRRLPHKPPSRLRRTHRSARRRSRWCASGTSGSAARVRGTSRTCSRIPGCRITAVCDIRPERTEWATKQITAAGHPRADCLHPRPARLRAAVRDRTARSRLQRHAVGVPRADHAGRDEEREAHRHRSAGGDDGRRLLGDGRSGREAPEALRADGELQLRPHGDDGLQHGPSGPVRRDPARRRRATSTTCASIKFADKGEGLWRRAWATKLNGNLYPTHGLGPIANCLDINRGDRFDYLVSMSGPSRGLQAGRPSTCRPTRPSARSSYVLGDVNVSLIKTVARPDDRRRALHEPAAALQPHPHGAGHEGPVPGLSEPRLHRRARQGGRVAGSRRASLDRVRASAVEGDLAERAQGAGHGGMDLHRGLPPDQMPARRHARPT